MMTLSLFLFALVLFGQWSDLVQAQRQVAFFEGFDDYSQFSADSPFYTSGEMDYFIIVEAANSSMIGDNIEYAGFDGNFFAVMDTTNDIESSEEIVMRWPNIDISGLVELEFNGLFAEDAADDGMHDWDSDSMVKVTYSIDGGPERNVLWFSTESSTEFNLPPREDTDFDGLGDGTQLTPTAQLFTKSIEGIGESLELVVTISFLDANEEDIAFDSFSITGELESEMPSILLSTAPSGSRAPSPMPSLMPSPVPTVSLEPSPIPTYSGLCPFVSPCDGLFNRPGVSLYNDRLVRCVERCVTTDILVNLRLRLGWQCGFCPP